LVTEAFPKRGEVWLASLDPTVGSEIRKSRPCLVLSPDAMNAHLRTVLAMPLTSGSHPAPFRIADLFKGRDGLLLGDQLRTLDKRRLRKRLGEVEAETLSEALSVVREMFVE
jgi:mRNA interferase MazF